MPGEPDEAGPIVVVVECGPEIHGNGVDEDCDGFDAACGTEARGDCRPDLTVTEIYPNPDERLDEGAWLEVQNTGDQGVDLLGAVVRTDQGVYTIEQHLALLPGEHALLAASALPYENGGLDGVDTVLPALRFGADADTVVLEGVDGTVLDEVAYDVRFSSGDAVPYRASLSLDPDQVDSVLNDTPTFWCDARSPIGDSGFGTPGEPNDPCAFDLEVAYEMFVVFEWTAPSAELVSGRTTIGLRFDESARWFENGGPPGPYTRGVGAAGQRLWFGFDTGVFYEAERGFGTRCFQGGSIGATTLPSQIFELLPESAWSNDGCP